MINFFRLLFVIFAGLTLTACPPPHTVLLLNNTAENLTISIPNRQIPWPGMSETKIKNGSKYINWMELERAGQDLPYLTVIFVVRRDNGEILRYKIVPLISLADSSHTQMIYNLQLDEDLNLYAVPKKFPLPADVTTLEGQHPIFHPLGANAFSQSQVTASTDGCVVSKLAEIFESPIPLDGKLICVQGYYHNEGQPVLHADASPSDDEYYEHAVILDTDDDDLYAQILDFESGALVTVKGILSVPDICWSSEDSENLVHVCSPFKKPVDLQVTGIVR